MSTFTAILFLGGYNMSPQVLFTEDSFINLQSIALAVKAVSNYVSICMDSSYTASKCDMMDL